MEFLFLIIYVDGSRFSPGIYIVLLQVDGKITKQQKLIKK